MRRQHYHKFKAQRTLHDGIKFDSKKEARYYETLKQCVACGDVIFFLRQVPLHLLGGDKYVIDFVEFRKDGTVHFVDVKGFRTDVYKAKKKRVENTYPITIEEV